MYTEHLKCYEDDFAKERHVEGTSIYPELSCRLEKSLYYGKLPDIDRPSLPITEIATELFQDAAPRHLGRLDNDQASTIAKKAAVSPCALMVAMIYVERLQKSNPEYLKQVSSSELFLVSMMVASKFMFDEGIDEEVFNDEWAESGSIQLSDLNDLERQFLSAIDWRLMVNPDEFWATLHGIEERIARVKGLERGYFTYMDLLVLTRHARLYVELCRIMKDLAEVFLACSASYVSCLATIYISMVTVNHLQSAASSFLRPEVTVEVGGAMENFSSTVPHIPDVNPAFARSNCTTTAPLLVNLRTTRENPDADMILGTRIVSENHRASTFEEKQSLPGLIIDFLTSANDQYKQLNDLAPPLIRHTRSMDCAERRSSGKMPGFVEQLPVAQVENPWHYLHVNTAPGA